MQSEKVTYDICDLIYFSFIDLQKVISLCSDDDLFHAFITMPNDVTYKCQLFFRPALLERRSKGLFGLGPIPLALVDEASNRIIRIMEYVRSHEELERNDIESKVYVKILNKDKDVWRGVKALRLDEGIYFIQDYPVNLPELYEEWEFPMTSIVKVRPVTKEGKIHLIAYEKFTGRF